jgi:hypothetical protein
LAVVADHRGEVEIGLRPGLLQMLMGKRRFAIAPGTRLHRALLRLTVIGARLFLAVDVLLNGPPGGGGRFGAFAETADFFAAVTKIFCTPTTSWMAK